MSKITGPNSQANLDSSPACLITSDKLRAWGCCRVAYRWFRRAFGHAAPYRDVFEQLAEDDRPDDAYWLIGRAGPARWLSAAKRERIEENA